MGRRKIEIKAIKDDRNRSVTFLKRKGGLFKKAHELSVLCSVDVAVIIFGHNKKLYEFSSGDMGEIIRRYSYYGQPHEHKGPQDFMGKKDMMEDDDDEVDMPSPREGSHSSQDRAIPHPALQGHPGLPHPHINSRQPTSSASPPMQNRNLVGPFPPQSRSTPQPGSRPDSRNAARRISNPPLNAIAQHQPNQNGFAYMPVPSVYQPPVTQALPIQSNMNPIQAYPYPPAPSHLQAQHPQQQYMQDQARRPSVPPVAPVYPPRSEPAEPPQPAPAPINQPLIVESRKGSKSRSMFTPIAQESSSLAMHWGLGQSTQEPASIRSHSVDVGAMSRKLHPHLKIEDAMSGMASNSRSPPRPASISTSIPDFLPPSRTNSLNTPGARPKLNIRIPSEPSDAGSATADSSPRGSGTTADLKSAQGTGTEGSHSGVVLPPPSPSASALLSAGASGPVNPFARPVPSTGLDQTPISALPSRFAEGLFPSPSTFYPEWGFSRGGTGPASDTLPSPLNFQTPILPQSSTIFKDYRDDEISGKRKSPASDHSDGSASKRVKT